MTPSQSFFAHWYFHIPNLVLAALIYSMIGRGVLSPLIGGHRVMVRALRSVTDPVLGVVGALTPQVVPGGLVIVLAVIWLFLARLALLFAMALMGVRPVLS